MARIQYTPYTKASGYRPQQVDDSNIARMREESQRTIQGMRENAAADINNRKEIAQQMKADQAYTKAAEEKNFQIQTDNARREAAGLAAKRQQQFQQYQADSDATKAIFEGVANLSVTASKIVGEIQKEQKQKKFNQDVNQPVDTETDLSRRVNKELLAQNDVARTAAINEGVAKTGNTKVGAELKAQSDALAYQFTEGQVAHYYKWRYNRDRNSFLELKAKELGRPLTYEEKFIYVGEFRERLNKLHGERYLSADLVKPYIQQYADASDTSFFAKANLQKEKADNDQRSEMALTNLANADTADLNTVFTTSFTHLVDIHGREKALELIENKVFLRQDVDGKFIRTLDEIGNIRLYPQGQPAEGVLFQDWFKKNRWLDIQSKRDKLDQQYRQSLLDADTLAFREESNELFKALGNDYTEDQVEEAQLTLWTKYGKVDPRFNTHAKKFTIESRLRAAEADRIAALPDYEITANDLIALQEVASPSEYAAVKQRYDAYNGKWRSKDAEAAVKRGLNVITGTTAFGTSKAAQPGAAPALRYFEAQALKNAKVMEVAMGGALPALEKAVADESARYLSSYREPTSVYYRKVEKDGSVSYPNLPGAQNISAANAALRDISNMRVKVKEAGNAEAALRIPNLVMSDARMDQVAQNYGKPGFLPNAKEMAFKGMTNGMPLHEVYNRAFAAAGRKERFASPLQNVGIKVPTHLQKVLNDPAASLVSKMNAVNVAMGNLEPYRNLAASGRAGSPLQKVLVTDPKDDTARSTGSDFVIQSGKRGARYLFPQQGKILKVVRDRPQEFRLEEGAKQRGYGNYVEVRFATPYGAADFLFSHFDKIGDFKVGQIVPRGAFMGTQGRSGSTTGAHISVDAFNVDSPTANPRARDWFLKTYLQQ